MSNHLSRRQGDLFSRAAQASKMQSSQQDTPITPSAGSPNKGGLSASRLLQLFGAKASPSSISQMERSSRAPQKQISYVMSDDSDKNERQSPRGSLFTTPGISPTKSAHSTNQDSGDELNNDTIIVASNLATSTTTSGRSLPPRSTRKLVNYARPNRTSSATPKQGRKRKAEDIIASDMMPEIQDKKSKKIAPVKPDTARNRVREDIATQTKAKRDTFLSFHRDYFLPVLPASNYVSKLVHVKTDDDVERTVVPNRQLTEQPAK